MRLIHKMKVTWNTSSRIHLTLDGKSTVCGHVFSGDKKNVSGKLHKNTKKRHCKTCFHEKASFKSDWIEEKC